MTDIVTEDTITNWDQELRELTDSLAHLFTRPEPKKAFADYVSGLLADVPKKNSWGLYDYLGYRTPRPLEHLLDGAKWDVDELRDFLPGYLAGHIGSDDAALVFDDTQIPKKGDRSVGVAPQHYGMTGDVANVQTVVMATYASEHGHAYTDRELYVPEEPWGADPDRRRAAGMPEDWEFATKPQLATRMLERAVAAGKLPFRWVVADADYGRDPGLRRACHTHSLPYVFEIPRNLPLLDARGRPTRPDQIHRGLPAGVFERRSAGDGTKGPRTYDWAAVGEATLPGQPPAAGFTHTLLVRKSIDSTTKDGRTGYDFAYFLVHARASTPPPDMIAGAGLRWKIE
ncbi:IS701 family transposase, partial [Frankia sp. CiP3]|uniref:IS701 family transposase n=1 Tax=Frankia sp. CiP3 TaxID=2880971 RepID=UPI001EF541AE